MPSFKSETWVFWGELLQILMLHSHYTVRPGNTSKPFFYSALGVLTELISYFWCLFHLVQTVNPDATLILNNDTDLISVSCGLIHCVTCLLCYGWNKVWTVYCSILSEVDFIIVDIGYYLDSLQPFCQRLCGSCLKFSLHQLHFDMTGNVLMYQCFLLWHTF